MQARNRRPSGFPIVVRPPEGKLHRAVQECSYKAPDVVVFLKHLLRHIRGKLLVVWDGPRSIGAWR